MVSYLFYTIGDLTYQSPLVFSDYVSKGDSIDEGTEYCEDCGKKEGNLERTNEATSNDCCCTGVDATDICLFEMEKT